jgi:hypothetical protein
MAAPPVELRLDLADRFALFEVHAIALLDANGQMLWQWAEARDLDELRRRGLHAVAAADGTGVLVLDAPAGASFLLPVPESVVRNLQSGGQLIVEATGLTPSSFISKLANGFEQQLTRQQAKLEEIQTALNHAQALAIERLEALGKYDLALAEAQRIAWEKEEKLELLDEQTRAALGERERELADLAGQLGQIESSFVWRAVRPLTGFHSRNKK